MNYYNYRLRVTLGGRLMSRSMSANEALLIATTILSQREAILAAAPEADRGGFVERLERLEAMRRKLLGRSQGTVGVVTVVPIPEELEGLGGEEELRNVGSVNNLLDVVITDVFQIVSTYAQRKRRDERRAAGERLTARWFQGGRRFLTTSSRTQWAETARRFEDVDEQTEQDMALLNVESFRDDILALNAWFARLQGIDVTQTEPEEVLEGAAPEPSLTDQAEELFVELFCLANATWRGDGEAAVKARQLVAGAWLAQIQSASRA